MAEHTYYVGYADWPFNIWVHHDYEVRAIDGDLVNGQQLYGRLV